LENPDLWDCLGMQHARECPQVFWANQAEHLLRAVGIDRFQLYSSIDPPECD